MITFNIQLNFVVEENAQLIRHLHKFTEESSEKDAKIKELEKVIEEKKTLPVDQYEENEVKTMESVIKQQMDETELLEKKSEALKREQGVLREKLEQEVRESSDDINFHTVRYFVMKKINYYYLL